MSSSKPQMKGLAALKAESATAYVNSPKGSGSKKPGTGAGEGGARRAPHLRQQRRRLSVVSDNKLVEGLATQDTGEEEEASGASKSVVSTYAGVSKKGYAPYNPKKKNQDSIIMEEHPETGILLLAALDGHGEVGDAVSQYFRDRIPGRVFAHPSFPDDIGGALRDVVARTEDELLRESRIDSEFSGTTCVIAAIHGNKLIVANIGDSRVILGRDDGDGQLVAEEVSIDHKPDSPEEKARILAAGGRVFAVEYDDGIDGPARVWLAHMDIPGLAMSRSLGDAVAHTAGVTSEPDIIVRELTPAHKVLVMGSDGLWEFITNEEVIKATEKHSEPRRIVRDLVDESYSRWMAEEQVVDDTTVIVAFLDV